MRLIMFLGILILTASVSGGELIKETPLGLEYKGETIRKDALGNYGDYRKNALGQWTNGEETLRKNALGQWESDKRTIRKTPLGWRENNAKDDDEY